MDRSAEVWTRATGGPRHLGKLVLAGNQVRFTYDREAGDLPGLSLVHDTAKLAGETFTWPSTEENPLPPMLQALVPPADGRNLQRRILTRILERRGVSTARGPDLEWELLLLGGRNAIGHLDVFADNTVAQAWYGTHIDSSIALDLEAPPLLKLAAETLQGTLSVRTIDEIIEIAEIHPTSGGAMPKVLLPISVPEHNEPVDALVKFQGEEYPDVLRLENAAYSVFDGINQSVPERWFRAREDAVLLATRRFDRVDGLPVPMESAFSALFTATGGKIQSSWSEGGTRPNFEMIAEMIFTPALGLSPDPKADGRILYERIVTNVLLGISDMHLLNFSFLGRRGEARLSPVYDPAPTRGYQSLACVSVVSFGGLITSRHDEPPASGEALFQLHKAFRLQEREARKIVRKALNDTEDFAERVRSAGVSDTVAGRLLGRIEGTRYRIERAIGG